MAKFHLIGIKGSGMSALAQVLHDIGHRVQGSDVATNFFTQIPLEQKRIPIFPFNAHNIQGDAQVIASNAFQEDHPEIQACLQKGIPVQKYHRFLGDLIGGFRSIAVSGAHGKTTTTGLLSHVFKALKPTSYLIGDGSGAGTPGSEYFIFESCEYRRHFLAYRPDYAIITNIDFDHPDYFKDMGDVVDAFAAMANQVKKHLIACGDDPQIRALKPSVPVMLYGFKKGNTLRADNMQVSESGVAFDVFYRNCWMDRFAIPMHGRHNVLNALAVIGVCLLEDIRLDSVKPLLRSFAGVKRRFSEKRWNDNIVIDDYAHHPTEIKATIEAVRAKYPRKRLVSVFQPHTYSRLERFMDGFADSLAASDDVYLCGIFGSARENKGIVTIQHLLERVPDSRLLSEQTVDQLQQYSDSVLLFMGAGDIQKYQAGLQTIEVS
jgi:UDP-N-acetylmuramate--alanine ligase